MPALVILELLKPDDPRNGELLTAITDALGGRPRSSAAALGELARGVLERVVRQQRHELAGGGENGVPLVGDDLLAGHQAAPHRDRAGQSDRVLDLERLRERAGIPSGTLHVLRHTAATLALTSGVPLHIVAARLGDDPRTVLSTYAHLLPQSDELAAERVALALV